MRIRTEHGQVYGPSLSGPQAAALLGISHSTVYELIDSGRFPGPTIDLGGPRPRPVTTGLLDLLGIPYTIVGNDEPITRPRHLAPAKEAT